LFFLTTSEQYISPSDAPFCSTRCDFGPVQPFDIAEKTILLRSEAQGPGAISCDDLGTTGSTHIIRVTANRFVCELDSMILHLDDKTAQIAAVPVIFPRVVKKNLEASITAESSDLRELTVQGHLAALTRGLTDENFLAILVGEAHILESACLQKAFLPYIRLMTVWCGYMCALGFSVPTISVVICLHRLGLAFRSRDVELYEIRKRILQRAVAMIRVEFAGARSLEKKSPKVDSPESPRRKSHKTGRPSGARRVPQSDKTVKSILPAQPAQPAKLTVRYSKNLPLGRDGRLAARCPCERDGWLPAPIFSVKGRGKHASHSKPCSSGGKLCDERLRYDSLHRVTCYS
jgi:hypothetical protein